MLLLSIIQLIYERLFWYVVGKINENVKVELPEGVPSTVISVIDIYGFEVFGVNRSVSLHVGYNSV